MSLYPWESSVAEHLLNMARDLRGVSSTTLMVALRPMSDVELAEVKLALDFSTLGNIIHLRAMVEEWDQERIVRETY